MSTTSNTSSRWKKEASHSSLTSLDKQTQLIINNSNQMNKKNNHRKKKNKTNTLFLRGRRYIKNIKVISISSRSRRTKY